jgi:hypothetical protein
MSETEKSIVDLSMVTNIRDYEHFLRSLGATKSRAKVLASKGWVTAEPETQPEPVALKRAMEMLAEAEREDFRNE